MLKYFLTFLLIFQTFAFAEKQISSLESLSKNPHWLALGHYKKTLLGYKSYIDSEKFFLAKQGKFNPLKELKATINAIENSEELADNHPACLYPARVTWLKKQIKLNQKVIPNCNLFNEWFSLINPKGVSLIFPTSFINNPASAFGHTFIRIDTENQNETNSMLSYASNFSANTNGENAILYAFKGLFGGYDGYFAVTPYYKLLRKYSELEKRDIWEYQLNFTEAEAEFMVKHLWELRKVSFIYYYFDENCSLHLLGLFEVVRPELKLREAFKTWVIPIDTIKKIISDRDLVKNRKFRPSVTTKLLHKINHSDSAEIKEAKKLAKDTKINFEKVSTFTKLKQAKIYELSYDYIEFLLLSNKMDDKNVKEKSYKLLTERSKIPLEVNLPKLIDPISPEEMHESSRFNLKLGSLRDNNYFEFGYRTAYHDLTDSTFGILNGSAIEFLEPKIRKYENESLKLQEFNILNIASLSPRNEMFKPLSWRFNTGLKRRDTREEQKLVYKTDLLVGRTYPINELFYFFGLMGPSFNISRSLDSSYSLGITGETGFRVEEYNSGLNFISSFKASRHSLGDEHSEIEFLSSLGYRISKSLSINLEYSRRKDYKFYYNDYSLRFNFYF